MLLYCITLSSSRENQHSAQEVARRISGAVAGEAFAKSRLGLPTMSHFWHRCRGVYAKVNIPSTHHKTLISRITLFAIFLSFSSPPLHPCRFIRPLSLSILPLFLYFSSLCSLHFLPLCLKLGKLLSIWTIIIS